MTGNPVTAFGGPGVLKILQLIERDVRRKRFHRPPLGPLGVHPMHCAGPKLHC